MAALGRRAELVDKMFLEPLSEPEREALSSIQLSHEPLAEAIRRHLAAEELTQGDLAESMGIAQSEFSKILNGIRPASADFVADVAQALGLPPETFLAYRINAVREWLVAAPERVDALVDELTAVPDFSPYRA